MSLGDQYQMGKPNYHSLDTTNKSNNIIIIITLYQKTLWATVQIIISQSSTDEANCSFQITEYQACAGLSPLPDPNTPQMMKSQVNPYTHKLHLIQPRSENAVSCSNK